MEKQEMKKEMEIIDMAKTKVMLTNSVWQDMKDNLSANQMILYLSCMMAADTVGIVAGKDWSKVVNTTEDDIRTLLDLNFIYEIKQGRSTTYVIADWWLHNSLPAKRLRKTSIQNVLDKLYIYNKVYNLNGEGTPAVEWLLDAKEDEEDTEGQKEKIKKQDKDPEAKRQRRADELKALGF